MDPFKDIQRRKASFKIRYLAIHDCLDGEGEYHRDLFSGLCPFPCSCEKCRTIRKNDHEYQQWLSFKRQIERLNGVYQVNSDLEARVLYGDEEQLRAIHKSAQEASNEIAAEIEMMLDEIATPTE